MTAVVSLRTRMWDWLIGQPNRVLYTAILAGGIYLVVNKYVDKRAIETPSEKEPKVADQVDKHVNEANSGEKFIDRMKSDGTKVLILYGSNSGTTEEYASRIAKDLTRHGQKPLILNPKTIEFDELRRLPEISGHLLVLCVATRGEGDPAKTARPLYKYLHDVELDLTGVRYTIFGLGDRSYEHFNRNAKMFDKRLEELGAERVYETGLSDAAAHMEGDFLNWRAGFMRLISTDFGWKLNNSIVTPRVFKYEPMDDVEDAPLFTGEKEFLGSVHKQQPPFNSNNLYLSAVKLNRELHSEKSDRNCRHLELSLNGSELTYKAGDWVGVFPENHPDLVESLLNRLDCKPDQAFRLSNTNEVMPSRRKAFPTPTTVKTALTYYMDITQPVKAHTLAAISKFCSDEGERKKLQSLSEDITEYNKFIWNGRRSVVDILNEFTSCRPPFEILAENLSKIKHRYYSISSSPKHFNESLHITVSVARYNVGEKTVHGMCTRFLHEKDEGAKVPFFIKKSKFVMPNDSHIPIIMIGAGTGLAPFRGFVQEKAWQKEQGLHLGETMLFFGCHRPDVDYLYGDELEKYEREGVISDLHLAFSRQQDHKIYVQHKLWHTREKVWQLIEGGGHVYVCGDAHHMAKDVHSTLLRIAREVGGLSDLQSVELLKEMDTQKRYQKDVWN